MAERSAPRPRPLGLSWCSIGLTSLRAKWKEREREISFSFLHFFIPFDCLYTA